VENFDSPPEFGAAISEETGQLVAIDQLEPLQKIMFQTCILS
jgi:hypothetical protein